MTGEDVKSMVDSHSLFLDSIYADPPKLDYQPGTVDIVTIAGGQYLPVLLVSLLMLRRTGSTLPVEVFLTDTSEYELQMCEVVFPSLNAKCLIMSDYLISS